VIFVFSPADKLRKEKMNNDGYNIDNENNTELAQHSNKSQDNKPSLHLVYKKVPITVEFRRRQYEEQLRQKYSIKKEKTGQFL